MKKLRARVAITVVGMMGIVAISVQAAGQTSVTGGCSIDATERGAHLTNSDGAIDIEMVRANIVHFDVKPAGRSGPRTLVIDPELSSTSDFRVSVQQDADKTNVSTSELSVAVHCRPNLELSVSDRNGHTLVSQLDPLREANARRAAFVHDSSDELFGMTGLSMREAEGGLLRNSGASITMGPQGEGGAPWFFTTRYGVLIDSDGGVFDARDDRAEFHDGSRPDLEYFVMVGRPKDVISALATVTGRPPMPPKWSLGFLNSQFGSNESEIYKAVSTYRAKQIPLDAFILDFDWKAWGEDNYGEWRWNSTSSSGNADPNKYPTAASGEFANTLGAEGVKLIGILKPRILLYKANSKTELHQAAAYAEAHGLWYPGEPKTIDYFTKRPARDLDFSKAETRSWYWDHLAPTFKSGMAGWWNDEADVTDLANGREFHFDNFQFTNMARCLYDGQRNEAGRRVWSLNRAFYLGAQRYGYAEWSGDIQTGFNSMARERMRMLATLDLGEPHWSMDTGGFFGSPTPENYARWMEFAAFVPIDRVHGGLNEKRQPWLFGPRAEAAATQALRLRYQLLPYIYSYERGAHETGVGIARPLFWAFPDDGKTFNDGSSWMFGDALLVSPVVSRGEKIHKVYLPSGTWYDYFRGTRLSGGQTVAYSVDSNTWTDIPLFVKSGSIIASQPWQNYVGEKHLSEVIIDVFPEDAESEFVYYDDDGETYGYEKGVYYRQVIRARRSSKSTLLAVDAPSGTYAPDIRSFVIRLHGERATHLLHNGTPMVKLDPGVAGSQQALKDEQWSTGQDRFGSLTTLKIPARQKSDIELQ